LLLSEKPLFQTLCAGIAEKNFFSMEKYQRLKYDARSWRNMWYTKKNVNKQLKEYACKNK